MNINTNCIRRPNKATWLKSQTFENIEIPLFVGFFFLRSRCFCIVNALTRCSEFEKSLHCWCLVDASVISGISGSPVSVTVIDSKHCKKPNTDTGGYGYSTHLVSLCKCDYSVTMLANMPALLPSSALPLSSVTMPSPRISTMAVCVCVLLQHSNK